MKQRKRKIVALYRHFLARIRQADHAFMVAAAVVIGVLGGLGAVGFRLMIRVVQQSAWGESVVSLDRFESLPWWWLLAIPTLGGLIVGPLVHFLAREAKGHGVPEVMEAVALRSGVIRPRLVVIKSLASAISIGSGGSVGREGPIVQIGSAIGSTLGQWLRVSGHRLRTLVGCGAAAGIAATFNAPLAGALFAVEVILGDFGVTRFSPIVIASVMATVVSRAFLGNSPAFVVPSYEMVSAWELITYLILGVLSGAVALSFTTILYKMEDIFDRIPIAPWLRTPIGGLLIGIIGLSFPQIFGTGYETIERALAGDLVLPLLGLLLVIKILATGITIGSGGSGGVFAPSLFLGAMTGGAVGIVANMWFPELSAGPGAYALVGMGAVVAGTTHAPITAILILFELTLDYKLILPLMAACIISTLMATQLRRESIYTLKLLRRGVDIHQGRDINVLRSLRVGPVMSANCVTVGNKEPFGSLIDLMAGSNQAYFYVVKNDGSLHGVIAVPEIRNMLLEADLPMDMLVAEDLAREDVPTLSPEQDLDTVMRLFSGKNREEFPVVASEGERRFLGIVTRRHILDAYNHELMKRDMVAGMSGGLAATSTDEVMLGAEYMMREVDAPPSFIGRTIRDLDVRAKYDVQILLIRREGAVSSYQEGELVPSPTTEILEGDRLVLMGTQDAIRKICRLS